MKKPERDFSEKPCLVWNERTGEDFAQEEARQRIENVSGFFQVLAEWDGRVVMRLVWLKK